MIHRLAYATTPPNENLIIRVGMAAICWSIIIGSVLLIPGVAQADSDGSLQHQETNGVLITEFIASPNLLKDSSTLLDEDGEANDWIELHNARDTDVDLTGWHLTDRANNLHRWAFPDGARIEANQYLVVFASGKDRRNPDAELHTDFSLKREGEYLALVDSGDKVVSNFGMPYPTQYTGVSYGYAEEAGRTNGHSTISRYMVSPTPGLPNGKSHGPAIYDVVHTPNSPSDSQDLHVSATILTDDPTVNVTLHYRFGFEDEQSVPMQSSGLTSYTAQIPTGGMPSGTLVRYYVTATEFQDQSLTRRWPLPCVRVTQLSSPAEIEIDDTLSEKIWLPLITQPQVLDKSNPNYVRCPNYLGVVVDAVALEAESDLPVMHWYVQNDPVYGWEWYRGAFDALREAGNPAWSFVDEGTTATAFYAGSIYDNIHMNLGGSGTLAFNKKEFEFKFNRDHELYLRGSEREDMDPNSLDFDVINLTTTGSDDSYIRQPLGWHAYAAAGVPAAVSFPIRLQRDGAFFSVAIFVEQPDVSFFRRLGLNEQGALFKSYQNSLTREHFLPETNVLWALRQIRPKGVDRKDEMRAFIAGINADPVLEATGQEGIDQDPITTYMLDNVDIPAVINYMAVRTVLDDFDTIRHNFYVYQDLDIGGEAPLPKPGIGEWRFLPWDKDNILRSRRHTYWSGAEHPFYGAVGYSDRTNSLMDAVIRHPPLRSMYLRRLVTVRGLLLGPDGGPDSLLGKHAIFLMEAVADDAILDRQIWSGNAASSTDVPIAAFDPTQLPVAMERRWRELSEPSPGGFGDLIPDYGSDTDIIFGEMMLRDDPDISAAVLLNCGSEAVDISGWELNGDNGLTYRFRPGVVIPEQGGRLVVTPNTLAFRAFQRSTGNQQTVGLFVQGGFDADLLGKESSGSFTPVPLSLEHDGAIVATSESTVIACPNQVDNAISQ